MAAPRPVAADTARHLHHPIEFLAAEHDRLRVCCAVLERLLSGDGAGERRDDARHVLDFLNGDLALHVKDEEEDLFPIVAQAADPDDGIETVLRLLKLEHGEDGESGNAIADDLARLADGATLPDPHAFAVRATVFVQTQRRHLEWENGILLPLARRRLGPAHLAALAQRMAERRGLDLPARR